MVVDLLPPTPPAEGPMGRDCQALSCGFRGGRLRRSDGDPQDPQAS